MYGNAKLAQGTNNSLQSELPLRQHAAALVLISALLVSATATAMLAGWILDIESLTGARPGYTPMKLNAALCFLLGSGPLFAILIWKRGQVQVLVRQALSLAVAIIAGLTLFEYMTAIDLGIDQLLVADTSAVEGSPPGRMQLLTAACFLLYGIAMTLPGRYTARYDRISTGLLALGLLGAILASVGRAYGATLVYRLVPATEIGILTSATFVALFVGGIATRTEAGWLSILRSPGPGGLIARRLLPAVLLLPPLIGWIALQGVEYGVYGGPFSMTLFAAVSVVIFTAIVWQGATTVEALDLAMRSRDRLNRRILETSLDAFVLMDDEGRVIEWNPQAERMFGWSRAEAIGRKVAELVVPPDQRGAHAGGLERFLATGEERLLNGQNEVVAWRRDGTEFPAELMIVPIQM
ncbi:MAG: PAS domain S-box protein, partial [Kiloniellales bacterium]